MAEGEHVGHASCVECGSEKQRVFQGKRRLYLKCQYETGGANCGAFYFQPKEGQERLRNRTTFITEQAAPAVDSAEMVPKEPAPEKRQEPTPEPMPIKQKEPAKKWSLWG